MKKHAPLVFGAILAVILTFSGMQAGIIPAIVPSAVPTVNRTASPSSSLGTARFLVCDTNENCTILGALTSGSNGGATGATDYVGKTSGSTVTLSVLDSTTAGALTLPGVTGTLASFTSNPTSGNCAQWTTSGGVFVLGQAAAACGSGGGGSGGGGFPGWSGGLTNTVLAACTPCFVPPIGGGTSSTTEGNVQALAPYAASGNDLSVSMNAAPGVGNTIVFTIRDNGVSTGVTCTITGGSARTCSDLTHTFTGAQGDTIDIQLSVTGTPATSQFQVTFNYGATVISYVLGALYVDTAETTASTTYTDLATLDTVTFTLGQTTNVVVQYGATTTNTNTTADNFSVANVDGTDATVQNNVVTLPSAPSGAALAQIVVYRVSLAAGSHTIKIRHKVDAGTGKWQARLLTILSS